MTNVFWLLIRLVVVVAVLASVIVLQPEFSALYAQRVSFNSTGTGFFWPIGTGSFRCTGGIWLGSDGSIPDAPPPDPRCGLRYRFQGRYHIGFDMLSDYDSPVFAISPGIVVQRQNTGWEYDNSALLIQHTLDDDSVFIALYGHIHTNFQVGDRVSGGVEIGTIGRSDGGNHLHFGIHPGPDTPTGLLGNWPNSLWDEQDHNGFVDPVDWITNLTPKCSNGSSERYTLYGTPRHPDGSLIQVRNNPGVYVLQNGLKREISSPQRLYELYGPGRGFDFIDVVIVSQAEFTPYPLGPYPLGPPVFDAIPYSGQCEPPGRLIQQRGQPEISMVTGDCVRRPFSGEAFLRLGYSFCNAAQVDDLQRYQTGPPILQ